MGFLDRIAADLISDSIGVSPRMTRKLVRKAVGNPLLLAGGAALAGALFSELARGQQQGTGSGPSTWAPPPPPGQQPPLPPIPSSGAAPPPPPTPLVSSAADTNTGAGTLPAWLPPPPPPAPAATTGAEAADQVEEKDAPDAEADLPPHLLFPVVRTMVAAALADGTLSAAERARIEEQLASGELPEEQAAQIRRELVMPATPVELAAMASTDAERELLYRFAALVTATETGISTLESIWLGNFAGALGLPHERASALEASLFGTPPAPAG